MKANISFEQNGSTTKTTYLPVNVPTRKIIALHFGLQHYNSPIKSGRDKTITATDGTVLSEWQSGTNLGVTMLYGGFSLINIMKATVKSNGDTWNFKWAKNVYLDALFAPLIRIQDITVANKTYDVKGAGAKGFETSPIGGRLGVASMASKVYIKYEIGWYPGLANRGLFTQATFGLSLIKNVKVKV